MPDARRKKTIDQVYKRRPKEYLGREREREREKKIIEFSYNDTNNSFLSISEKCFNLYEESQLNTDNSLSNNDSVF